MKAVIEHSFLEVDVKYTKQRILKIVPERMKIQMSQKRVFNLYNMTKCVIQVKILNHGLVLQKNTK